MRRSVSRTNASASSWASASVRPQSAASCALTAAIATGAQLATRSAAYARAAATSSSRGNTRSTKPSANASSATTTRLETSRSAARAGPIIRVSSQLAPNSAGSPRRVKEAAILMPAAANRRSHDRAWIRPMPAQAPLTTAMVGLRNERAWVMGRVRHAGLSAAGPCDTLSRWPISIPGQKLLPAPVTSTTRTAGSSSQASSRSKKARSISSVQAFFRSGRCRVSVAMPLSTSQRTSSGAEMIVTNVSLSTFQLATTIFSRRRQDPPTATRRPSVPAGSARCGPGSRSSSRRRPATVQ